MGTTERTPVQVGCIRHTRPDHLAHPVKEFPQATLPLRGVFAYQGSVRDHSGPLLVTHLTGRGIACHPHTRAALSSKVQASSRMKFFQELNIANTGISTTVQRTLTSLPVSASYACNGLSLLVRHSGSLLPMVPSLNIFVCGGIGLPRPPIVKRWAKDSRFGRRSTTLALAA